MAMMLSSARAQPAVLSSASGRHPRGLVAPPAGPPAFTLRVAGNTCPYTQRVLDAQPSKPRARVVPASVAFGTQAWGTLFAYIAQLAVNVGAQLGAFGQSIVVLQAAYPVPLSPAVWAFSIWSLIYQAQGLGVIYLCLKSGNSGATGELKERIAKEVCPWWIVGWFFQCAWLYLFSQNTQASLLACAGVLVAASLSFHRALGKIRHIFAGARTKPPRVMSLLFAAPTSINAAWVTVATCLGVLIAFKTNSGADLLPISVGLAAAVLLLGVRQTWAHRDIPYAFTLIWSFAAILVKQDIVEIVFTAGGAIGVLALAVLAALFRKGKEGGASGGDASSTAALRPA